MNQNHAHGFTRNVLPALAYVVFIFVAGTWPQGIETEPVVQFQDKVLHLIAFAGLEVLLLRALRHLRPAKGRAWLLSVSVALACLFGGLLELWQALLPFRQAETLDWVADALGAALAALASARSNAATSWSLLPARPSASKR